jgi:Rrf2 family iron-sulfur cluster assembly transcriptional regulator
MNISRKTRYATRALMELAFLASKTDVPVQVQEISKRQRIPERYLENIFSTLVKAGILTGIKGKGGGFRLALPAEKISLDMVVEVLENPLSSIACLDNDKNCAQSEKCVTRKIWAGFSEHVRSFFHKITLADLVGAYRQNENMYYI